MALAHQRACTRLEQTTFNTPALIFRKHFLYMLLAE
jgi:hypothetical protein